MAIDLKDSIRNEIAAIAQKYNVQKIVLFGSRARGDNQPRSDIDLAVYGCHDFVNFAFYIDEKVWTLLSFDIIDMDKRNISTELIKEIERDGVVIYEI